MDKDDISLCVFCHCMTHTVEYDTMRVKTGVITSRGLKNFDTATAPLDSRCDILIGGIEAARKMLMMQEM